MSQHRFPALKTIAWILRIFAWVVAVIGIIFFVLVAFTTQIPQTQFQGMPKIWTSILVLLGAALYFLLLYAAAEGIMVVIAIEENTRKIAEK